MHTPDSSTYPTDGSLPWLDRETLYQCARNRFSRGLSQLKKINHDALNVDPTSIIARAELSGMAYKEILDMDVKMRTLKSLQNAIGLFHQDILGSCAGWQNTGTSGGVFDISSEQPVALAGGRRVFAEVKMRYNTIKASDEKNVHDDLASAVKMNQGPKHAVGYLIQIVPKGCQAYDQPWKVSGRPALDYVRHIDGVSAYHLVTGYEDAFAQLLHALPSVFREVRREVLGTATDDLTEPPLTSPQRSSPAL